MASRRVSGGCASSLVVVAILIALAFFAWPQLRHGFRIISLMREESPQSLPIPVAGVRPSQLRDTWGAPRGGGRRHEGIDIFARRNTPVFSTTRGIVWRRGHNQLGGLVITVLGPGGHYHYYAHLENWGSYAEGDWVERGDTLGFVGTSGNALGTPPHLHYGIYTVSGAINPYPLLR